MLKGEIPKGGGSGCWEKAQASNIHQASASSPPACAVRLGVRRQYRRMVDRQVGNYALTDAGHRERTKKLWREEKKEV